MGVKLHLMNWHMKSWSNLALSMQRCHLARVSNGRRGIMSQKEEATLQPVETQECASSKNKAKNEAKKAAKMEKFMAKQAKCNFAVEGEKSSAAVESDKSATYKKVTADSTSTSTVAKETGEKKVMEGEMASSYDPIAVEAGWYSWWEKSGLFKPEVNPNGEVFTMVMPPPNVTGSLHIGHATMVAIEDTLVRWHRMNGKSVLYLPGCDHAGIATQAVVEKMLMKEQSLTKHDLGREKFVEKVWEWKDKYGHRIYDQFRRLGTSADWDRACFTLDPKVSRSVSAAFVKMFEEGIIFRANRLVNWCGKLKTSLSDLEVEMKEIEGGAMLTAHGHAPNKKYKFGTMTFIAYKVEGAEADEIIIGTTRPETLFADTALCVHPTDPRYVKYHGKNVIHPILNIPIPIILDEAADPNFGTGALKVSPAHDPIDFQLGQKHGLKFKVILDENNILNEACGEFAGMPRYEAREAVVEYLKKTGSFREEKPHPMSIPICSRSGDFVEPRLIPQWWLDCKDMAAAAVNAVREGEIEILPKEHEKIWYHWLENIKDWCISRQLWWGHRIPAYQVLIGQETSSDRWVAATSEEEAMEKAKLKFKNELQTNESIRLKQDEDVMDTWFSSGLWPFSTLGWPDNTSDLAKFYPNSLMETGSDIIFFWVARMVMLGMHLTGKIPFPKIFLHAIVRDAHGRKMSKSLGNVIDPLDVIEGISLADLQARLDVGNLDPREVKAAKEIQKKDFPRGIPQCGSDALRFGLCSYIADGRDINMSISRIEGYRRFCNKLWNATKFALMKLGTDFIPHDNSTALTGDESIVDKWILTRLDEAIKETSSSLEEFNLMNATQAVYSFWLYDLCDVYIEAIKPICSPENNNIKSRIAASNVLYTCLEQGLRLLHPFMPFITEELYQRLPRRPTDTNCQSISITPYPVSNPSFRHSEEQAQFEAIYTVVKSIRSHAADQKLPKTTTFHLHSPTPHYCSLLTDHEAELCSLVKSVGQLKISDGDVKGKDIVIEVGSDFIVGCDAAKSS